MGIISNIKNIFFRFLKKTEKYTGTDMIYLAKGGFWLSLSQIISSLASFLLSIAFANFLDPVTYGNYRYILSLMGILGIFSLRGMGAAITQAVSRGLEGSFYGGFKTKLKWGILGSLSSMILAGYYSLQGNYTLPIPLLICALFLPLSAASHIYRNFLNGKKAFHVNAQYNIWGRFIYVGASITALFLTKNLFWLIAAYFVSTTLPTFFFYLRTKKRFLPNKKEDPKTISYGKHLSLMDVINNISSYLDRFLIFHYLGAANLAVYYFAITMPQEIRAFLATINVLALPKLSVKSKEEIKINLIGKLKKLLFLATIVVFSYILISPFIYKIFFPKYLDSLPYSQIYIFSLFSFPAGLLITSFRAKKIKKELYQFKIIIPLVKIILLLILIPLFGIWGLVFEEVGIAIFTFGLALFLFKRI